MQYISKKEFNGYVSVRNYVIDKCIKNNEDLKIKYKDEIMIIPAKNLKTVFQLHHKKFKSKYNEKTYELFDFKFIPNNKKSSN